MPLQKTTPEEIIRKSIDVFRRKGYYRTNMSDLAKETGLTKGAFYHHFSNKEEVMRKALMASAKWFERKIFSIAYDDDLLPKQRLEKMADKAFKAFTAMPGGCFFANTILETAHVEDSFLKELKYFFDQWEQAFAHVFTEKYEPKESEAIAQAIIADIEGSIVLMQLYKDEEMLKKAFQRGINRI